jgi:hypothetical protein
LLRISPIFALVGRLLIKATYLAYAIVGILMTTQSHGTTRFLQCVSLLKLSTSLVNWFIKSGTAYGINYFNALTVLDYNALLVGEKDTSGAFSSTNSY